MEYEERLKAALADRYQIEREIGSGGMATVYLAQDLKHDRQVAVKVLRPELAAVVGTERFLAEIRTTANLAHPHIVPLFDSGEADGFLFYVMPHVEGESLRQKLDRNGQLPVEEAVRIAGRMADALDYAHQQGVIHRDIKPGNILFQAGDPVVTDFGIALAISAAGEGRLTETGLSLGTPYYMSPEQAAGEDTPTAASDVYSLGCVLYEMLTGDPPHTGSSAQAILGKILLGEVTRPTKLRRTIPANVEGSLLKALERLPADRFESAGELAAALKDKGFRHGVGAGAETGPWKLVAAALAAMMFVFGGIILWSWQPDPPLPVNRTGIALPPDSGLVLSHGPSIALSPDGSQMVYVGPGVGSNKALWVKEADQLAPRRLPGTEEARQPFYSPDGQRIGFFAPGDGGGETLKVLSLAGESPQELARTPGLVGGSWGPDGFIYVGAEGLVLGKVPSTGGEVVPITSLAEGEMAHRWPEVLPDGKAMIFTIMRRNRFEYDEASIGVADLATGEHRVLTRGALARYSPTGHLLVVQIDGTLQAVPLDEDRITAGDPTTLAEGILFGSRGSLMAADIALSSNGTLLYVEGAVDPTTSREMVWVDRSGTREPVDPGWGRKTFETLALSPDGSRLAVDIRADGVDYEPARQIWVKELPTGTATRLTTEEDGWNHSPVWSPDGTTIAYWANRHRGRIRTILSDGRATGAWESLLEDLERTVWASSFTPDGSGLFYSIGGDLGYLDLASGERNDTLLATEFSERAPTLSPDGRWLAYTSDATGVNEVFVRPFPDVRSGITKVSRDEGTEPLWGRDGHELFYRRGDGWMMAATYNADSTFVVEEYAALFDAGAYRTAPGIRNYDYSPPRDRFVMTLLSPSDVSNPWGLQFRLIQIQNFFTELEERVGR